jgi:hypothetical protein
MKTIADVFVSAKKSPDYVAQNAKRGRFEPGKLECGCCTSYGIFENRKANDVILACAALVDVMLKEGRCDEHELRGSFFPVVNFIELDSYELAKILEILCRSVGIASVRAFGCGNDTRRVALPNMQPGADLWFPECGIERWDPFDCRLDAEPLLDENVPDRARILYETFVKVKDDLLLDWKLASKDDRFNGYTALTIFKRYGEPTKVNLCRFVFSLLIEMGCDDLLFDETGYVRLFHAEANWKNGRWDTLKLILARPALTYLETKGVTFSIIN